MEITGHQIRVERKDPEGARSSFRGGGYLGGDYVHCAPTQENFGGVKRTTIILTLGLKGRAKHGTLLKVDES